jgi:hypothetical protein
MRQQHHHEDDDGPIDKNGVLKDGHTARVSMMLRDGSQHRPGFRLGDNDMCDERQKARAEYLDELTNAWRGDARRKKSVTRDPEGRLLSEEELDDARPPVRDGRTLDEVRRDHQRKMAIIYQAYDSSIQEQWRKP